MKNKVKSRNKHFKKRPMRNLGRRALSFVLVVVMLVGILPSVPLVNSPMETVEAASSYTTWKQMDSPWGSKVLYSMNMAKGGCRVTSMAMLLVKAGLKNESNFDPGIALDLFKQTGVVNSSGDINEALINRAVSGFTYCGQVGFASSNQANAIECVRSLYQQGYYCELFVTTKGKRCNHAVALDRVEGNTVYMIDPGYGSRGVQNLFAVHPTGIDRVYYFKSNGSVPPDPVPPSVNPDDYPVPTGVLSYGSRGEGVKWLQAVINKVADGKLNVDGVFGNGTNAAVRSFQSWQGLTVDGKVGYYTRTRLQEMWEAMKVVDPTGITISATSMNVTTGKTGQLSASVQPANASNKNVTWSSSDNNIATVNNGVITGKAEGQVTIKASTSNGKTASCKVNVYNMRKVVFVNEDDSLISEQSVEYGKSAKAPTAPEKTGYTFAGWDGTYQNVTKDATIKATYTKNTYKVTFRETDGTKIDETQSVPYNEAATAPEESKLNIPDGYIFKGWSESFEHVTGDMTIYPVYEWADDELPIVVSDANCKDNNDGTYYLTFKLTNHSTEKKNVRVMSYMMTNSDMLVAQGETRTVSIPAATDDGEGNVTDGEKVVSDLYIVCSSSADKARVVVLDDYESAVPLADMKDITVDAKGYSNWSDENPTDKEGVETRTLYHSKNVKYTTSTSSSLSGWTKYDSKVTSYTTNNDKIYYGNGRSATPPASTNARAYWAEAIYYSCDPNIYTVPTYNISVSTTGGDTYRSMVRWIQSALTRLGYSTTIDGVFGYNTAAVVKSFQSACGLSADGIVGAATRTALQNGLNAQPLYNYYYHTKTPVTTYYYYQTDSAWSDWVETPISGDTVIAAGTTKVLVETKTQYRYKQESTTAVAEGEVLHPECELPEEAAGLAGKNAMVIVFKNKVNQIAEDNVEYVGMTKIGDDGGLDISFVPREEQSYEGTGDYTVVLGVKGTTNYVKVGVIEAKRPVYHVTFVGAEGEAISAQEIPEGHDAEVPKAPEREGYTFIGWDTGVTNVHDDLTIVAQYEKKNCTVTYVDWENRTIENKDVEYGSVIELPEAPEAAEGMEFAGWSVEEGSVVTENMVCEASFKEKVYKVTFVDWEGKVVMEEEVPHGEAAMEPEVVAGEKEETKPATESKEGTVPEKVDNMTFVSWGEDIDLACVTTDLVVGAIYLFDETVLPPDASVAGGEYKDAQTVELTSKTEGATIYYTTDGSDPTDVKNAGVKQYNGAINLTSQTRLKFYACKMGMNDSPVIEEWYAINTVGNIPTHVVSIEAVNTFDITELDSYREFFKDGDKIDPIKLLPQEYESVELEGIYYDDAFEEKWQSNAETVTESLILYAKYVAKKFDVTYQKEDGTIIKTDKVEYGCPVDDSVAPAKEGYRFVGWESEDDCQVVTKAITVKAKYLAENEYVTIKFGRNSYSVMEGAVFKLTPKLAHVDGSAASGEMIEWTSSNENLAVIDTDGNVSAISKGQITAYAKVVSSGEMAECTINITGNPETSVCLLSNSTYRLENGYLRNIDIGKNTVAELRKQINADSLRFVDSSNIELEETERVGTGTRIQLLNSNGAALDEVMVIIVGDYNGDGLVNAKDVSGLSRMLRGKEEATEVQLKAVDVNGDGHVNNRDAAMLARYLVGKEKL